MLILRILRSLLLGVLFTLLSVSLANFFASSMKQVYHTIWNLQKNKIIFAIILISLISSTTWIVLAWGKRFFWADLLLLFTMNLIAIFDGFTGRIPVHLLLIGFVLGLIIGSMKNQIFIHFIGGVSNLMLSMIIFLAGQVYKKKVMKQGDKNPVFGMGDVYACSALGFLFGSPVGNLAILFVLILAVLNAALQSLLTGVDFLQQHVKLGVSFYLATVLILIAKYL